MRLFAEAVKGLCRFPILSHLGTMVFSSTFKTVGKGHPVKALLIGFEFLSIQI